MSKEVLVKLKNISAEEVLERKVAVFGTGAHVIVPQKYIGREIIILLKE